MRAGEILFEDNRSKIQKLRDLINHPCTEDTIRDVAQSKLELLLASTSEPSLEVHSRITVQTNVAEKLFDQQFIVGVTIGQIYEGLCSLSPSPSKIYFLRQGQIQMMVPPPMMGKTRQEFYRDITMACSGIKVQSSSMVEGQGYFFVLSYI